jgi:purine nucleoside phosphorylase
MDFKLNEDAETRAEGAARDIREFFKDNLRFFKDDGRPDPEIAVLFTSGLMKFVPWSSAGWSQEKGLPFNRIFGFDALPQLGKVEGHARELSVGVIAYDVPIWCLNGRIHLNEYPSNPGAVAEMVRLQIDMLAQLGIKVLITTSAVGSCTSAVRIGQIGVVEHCLSDGQNFTGCSGEFVMLEGALDSRLRSLALNFGERFQTIPVTHRFWMGPRIEGPLQKAEFARQGAHVVGMSCQPEIEAAARHGMKVLALCYVTNGDAHSHGAVLDAVEAFGLGWMRHLEEVVEHIPEALEWN